MSSLRNHPFGVQAHFKRSLVLTFAVPKIEIEAKIPNCLRLDHHGEHAFIAVAMVDTRALRPKGFPKIMGNDFFLIGYRVFVRYTNSKGKNLRGLYILKSETNKKKMEVLGSIFTRYKYATTDIHISESGHCIKSNSSNFLLKLGKSQQQVNLPENSPFKNWKEARRFAGPLPHTFTYLKDQNSVLVVKGLRQNWKPRPIEVLEHRFQFLDELNFSQIHLANAFEINNVDYEWESGNLERWK